MYQFQNTICIAGSDLIISDTNPGGLISKSLYDKLSRTKVLDIKRKGCKGSSSLIAINSLPDKYQNILFKKYGDCTLTAYKIAIKDQIKRDFKAVEFYSNFRLDDGRALPNFHINLYSNDATLLNAIYNTYNNAKATQGVSKFWQIVVEVLKDVIELYPNTLPFSEKRLKERYNLYVQNLQISNDSAYATLISKKFNNDNSRKVTALVEKMLLSLYTLPNKPFGSSVHEMYQMFLNGRLDVVDKATGEFFNREDFKAHGQFIEISDTTVWNYLNNPLNRALVDKSRLDILDYNNTHRPHHRRHAPNFSFSKVSMDDRDLPRKINGGDRVKAYYAYDVASGAVVGASYSRNKNEALFIECLQNMFRLMDNKKWGVPLEIEVENHLVNKYFDDLAIMFPLLRICAPGNSQEKHAEHFNKAKKYGTEKKTQVNIGRWWAKSEAYRTRSQKVSNEYVEKSFAYDFLVAEDMQAVRDYNNTLHPKQKKYPNMTRWDVLCSNMNPHAILPNKALWIKSIGDHAVTSIKRSGFVTANYTEFRLPNPTVIAKLKPNNYTVDAYWLADDTGHVSEIHLYQQRVFICTCKADATYNTAKGEWTTTDKEIMESQANYVAQFDKMIKDGRSEKIIKPELITSEIMQAFNAPAVEIAPPAIQPNREFDVAQAITDYSNMNMSERGLNNI